MLFFGIFLIAAGLLMLSKPGWVWNVTERWKTSGAEEPSAAYIWSLRLGGVLCTGIGLLAAAVELFLR